jgi:hypothetical protein
MSYRPAMARLATAPESRQAGDVLRLRMCASQPRPAKPASIIAQVEASGTAGVSDVMLMSRRRYSRPLSGPDV